MIKLFRLDERLIHGQVAFAWCNSLNINCIFIANDNVANDQFRQNVLKMATPPGVRFVAKNLSETLRIFHEDKIKKYNVLLLTDSTKDAKYLCQNIEDIHELNLGNAKKTEAREVVTRSIALTPEEKGDLKDIIDFGVEVEIREVPSEKKVLLKTVLS